MRAFRRRAAFKFSACDKQSRRKIVDDRQTGARLDPLTHKGGCRMFNEASGDPILPPDGQQKKRTKICVAAGWISNGP